ncbi:hypothetical protein GBAR_LOCUS10968 [Geodia barretti]|uniref:Uncharacterized protein n=1 Tax=Geodia barretti TaxID=519541 RepID=A0AA35WKW8_GEOBA|nr:hypothetical protein GBAR_LOCUS10968 [Geodia barretti]
MTAEPIVFPSLAWFEELRRLVNDDSAYRQFGTVDASMGVKIGDGVFVLAFEAFECTSVRSGSEYDLINVDFFIEMEPASWRAMLESIKCNGGAEAGQTLVSLDMLNEISNNATGDQLRADMFFRYNQSLQHFFDLSANLNTVFAD